MSKQEQELLRQLDGAYTNRRMEQMAKLQNKLVKDISNAQLPSQDILMVLTVLAKQVEANFISRFFPKKEKDSGGNMEETSLRK